MDPVTLLAFGAALALSTASPGPTITALVARVLSRGLPGAFAFCAGLVLGDLVWLAAAVFGLAAVAEAAQPVLWGLKWAGVAFLLWLAWKAWTAPAIPLGTADRAADPSGGGRLALAGVALTLGNPKTMLFYTAVTPAILDPSALDATGFALLAAVLVPVYAAVLATYVALALRGRRFLRSARAVRGVNRAAGVAMAGAAAAVATR